MSVDPKLKSVPHHQLNKTYTYFWSIPVIQMCRNMIRQNLFSNGIDFKGKNGQTRQTFSQQVMEDFWLPFCEDALDSALCYGFVVWRTRKIDGGIVVPIVCLKDTYSIKLKEVDGVIEYTVFDVKENSAEKLKDAHVYDEFGYRPRADGALMSLMNVLVPDIQYYITMMNCQVAIERKRVAPPILTTINTGSGGNTGEKDGIDYGFFADADVAEAEEESRYKRNQSAVESLRNQQALYDDFFNDSISNDTSAAPAVLSQMVPLPSGQTVVSHPIQQGRNDTQLILKHLQDTICGVLGVPKSMIMSDTPHKSDETGTHQMFYKTVLWWKRQLSEMCQLIYNMLNAKEIANKIGERMAKRKEVGAKEVYMATKSQQSVITFPVTPNVSNEELYDLYDKGVLTWEQYCNYISRNTSIPIDVIPPEPKREETQNPDKPEKKDNTDKPEKKDKPEKTEKTDKPEKTGKTEKTDKPEKTGKTRKAEKEVDTSDTKKHKKN